MNYKSVELERSGDITSRFEQIYDSTYKDVISFIAAKCGNPADINDIAQETYVELYTLLLKRGADYVQNDKAIVIKLAKQKLYSYYKLADRLRMLIPLHFSNESEGGGDILLSDLQKTADDFLTEDFVADKLTLEEARDFIAAKPLDVRKIFHLYFDMELTLAEIAVTLGLKESNVKNKLYRTLKELRKMLGGEGS
jgi:RNA polymerase sigma-70 factor (ECF subfamily)